MRRLSILAVFVLLPLGACLSAQQSSQQKEKSPPPPDTDVAARIGDRVITLEEVDRKGRETNLNAYQALYSVRRQALDEILAEVLLEQKAAASGVTSDELVKTEIDSKVKPVTDADIETFYNQNRARMGGRTLDQIRDQIRGFLENQNLLEARKNFLDQAKKEAGVVIALQPPRAEVRIAAHDPVEGSDSAKVTIVEFFDFQ